MIKLSTLLKEIEFNNLGEPFDFGDEQTVWKHPEDKNLVIKKYGRFSHPDSIKRIINYYEKYPDFIVKSLKSDNSDYYFQEKLDVKSSWKDISQLTLKTYNQVIEDLSKKYSTPQEAYKAGFKNGPIGNIILNNTDFGDKKGNWGKLFTKSFYGLEGKINVPMSILFDPYVYENYTKNLDLVKKLKPIYNFGVKHTLVGAFHEKNLGYDKNKNFKILDI
jgi:hypothetical protein